MASIASVLQILVQANADDATRKLNQFDDKMARTRAEAAKKIEAQLGANFDRKAFAEYEARLKATQEKVKNRAAFKAALGADFDPRAFSAYQRALSQSESDTRRMSGSLGALEKRFTGGQNKVEGFNAAMMGLRNVVGLVRWPAMIAGAGLATQAIGALASGAIGLVAALAPLASAGAAAAAGYVAIGQGMGVWKLATDNLKKALAGSKTALAQLTPGQRVLLKDLQAMKKEFRALQDVAARGITPGLEKAVRSVTPLLKVLSPIVAATAKELGNLAAVAGKTAGGWGKDLATVGKTNVGVIHNLGLAAISLGNALKNVVVVAGPLLTWMSGLVRVGAAFVDKQVQAGRESGKLAAFLQQTRSVMSELGHVAMNLGVAFFNIGKAAAPLGRDLLQSLVKLTAKFREWTGSAEGQNKLATYFQNMKAPLYAIFGLVGDIGKALIQLSGAPGLTHVVNKLRELVPVLKGVIGSTTQAFSQTFIDALANVVRLFGDLAGTSGPLNLLVKAVGWVAGAIHSLLKSSPGMHSFVVDFVGFGAAVKALSFIPKLPFIGPLISLFTASGRAKSLASLLSLGGLKGGAAGGLAGKVSTSVATMEVGTLIAKTTVGGGAGSGLPTSPGNVSRDVKTAEDIGRTGKVVRLIESGGKLIPIIAAGGVASQLLGASMDALPKLPGPQRPRIRPTASNPQGIPQAGSTYDTLGNRYPTPRTASNPQGIRLGQSGGIHYLPGNNPLAAFRGAQQAAKDLAAVNAQLQKLTSFNATTKQTAAAFDQLAQKARKAGDVKWAMADTLGAELLRTHNVASRGVQQLVERLNTLAPGARTAAAQSMLQMTQTLETNGQLPKGATNLLVADMLQHYRALKDKGGTYFSGLLSIAGDRMRSLQQVAATTTGHAHDVAVRQINALRQGVTAALTQTEKNTEQQMGKLAGTVGSRSGQAASTAGTNFKRFSGAVQKAMADGTVATNTGMRLIAEATNSVIRAFGGQTIPVPRLMRQQDVINKVGSGQYGVSTAVHERGGMVKQAAKGLFQVGHPGQSGRDNVPLNVGGTPIMVGAGEQVAVFNRHQQQVVNGALAPMGGLPGLFSKVNRPHYMAGGGIVSFGGLQSLWTQAGGPSNLAPLMAAIAEAESGGNPAAHNPSGASGLWQILGQIVGGNVFDPMVNARNAVAKWRSQGLGAWEAYTNGAFRRFLGGANAPAGTGVAGVVQQITAPQVQGKGALSNITRAVLGKATAAANAYIARQTPSFTGMGATPGPPGGPTGVGTFQGLPVANWVIAALQYAQSKGVRFRITSGYRPGFDPHAPSGSEHAGTQYPHGAVDFGGMVDPAVLGEKLAVVNATRSFKWPLLAPQGFRDDGHASGTGHARGGIVRYGGAFRNGGIIPGPAGAPTMILAHGGEVVVPGYASGGVPISPPTPPHARTKQRPKHIGTKPAISTGFRDIPSRAPAAPAIPSIAQVTGEPGLPKLGGKTPAKAAGAGQVQGKITALRAQIDGLEHQFGIFDSFYNLTTETFVDPNTGEVDHAAVNRRLAELDSLIRVRQKVFQLWGQVVAHTQRLVDSNRLIISRLQKALGQIKTKGLKGKALTSAQGHQSKLRSDIATYRGNLSTALGDLTSAGDDRDSAWISLLQLQGERSSVAGTQATPVAATTTATTTPTATTPDPSVALLQTLLTQSQQTLAVSQAQYSVFQGLPPFGGSFADGGVVPGPLGAARTIVAHGGETVSNGQPTVQVIIQDGAVDPNKIQVIAENAAVKVTRGATALQRRRLPGGF